MVVSRWCPGLLLAGLLCCLLPAVPANAQRLLPLSPTQWQQDLQVACDSLLAHDRSFTPAARTAFRQEVKHLQAVAVNQTQPQRVVGLARAVAGAGNAHTRLYLLRNRTELRRYPIRVWWFRDGLYVVKTTAEYADLLGAKVLRLAGLNAAQALRRVAPLYAGNASWQAYISTYTLTSPEILQGLGILTDTAGTLPLVVRTRTGQHVARQLVPLSGQRSRQALEAWWDLSPLHPGRGAAWQSVLPADSARLPLYLRRPEQGYWHQALPAQHALYLQYNRAGDMPSGESVKAWGARVLPLLPALAGGKLIVDLRFNTGGNLDVASPFFEELAAQARQHAVRVYVLTGRATFSAGLYHAAQLRQLADAQVVGEPAGDTLDFWAEGGNFVLPNSGLTVHYADRFHGYSRRAPTADEARWLYRDLAVETLQPVHQVQQQASSYLAGQDPALDYVLRP
ncbi:hypothetical protein [Hymenobacter sp. BT491]|uniref:hypothetical protein n=1 Tax=Hymenobacter sp. BT491 TaxID=2766779 RepID=UPI001653EB07|nr:hypothetical protein [Hymenobacter sp. BT491]MBC6988397.1 hypothetical protein [Hymenobacter sp. BT491]